MSLISALLKNLNLSAIKDTILEGAPHPITTPPTVPGKTLDSFQLFSPEQLKTLDPQGILSSGRIHPELRQKAEKLLFEAERQGLKPQIVEGFRSLKAQQKLIDSGRGVTNATPGNSFHNYGLALDIAFRDGKNRPSWAESHDWKKLGQIGKSVGLTWGGDWKKTDRPHFQLPPQSELSKVKSLTRSLGMEKMWESIP